MRKENFASIEKAKNGFVIRLTQPPSDKDDWDNTEQYVYATLDEAIGAVVKYFHEA